MKSIIPRQPFPLPALIGLLAACLLLPAPAGAQQAPALPDFFIRLTPPPATLQDGLATARQRATTDRYWVGYQTALRADLDFSDRLVEINENGGITITHGSGIRNYRDEPEDDLELTVYRALAEMGDEKSKKIVKQREGALRADTLRYDGRAAYAFYLQFDRDAPRVQQLRFLPFRHANRLHRLPTFWLGSLAAGQSFAYLRGLFEDAQTGSAVQKAALFLISLHASPEVIPFLTAVAKNRQRPGMQKKAVFWLGQIPGRKSLDALTAFFEAEKNGALREEMVFAFSQHRSRDAAAGKLVTIARSDPDLDVRKKAIFWLGQSDREGNLRALRDLLDTEAGQPLRKKIVFAISQHSDRDEAARLLIDIARTHPSPQIRKKAIFWLGQIGNDAALAFFKEILAK